MTGTDPVPAREVRVGSHRLLAEPSAATTMLHALIGSTPSIGPLCVMVLVGRSFRGGRVDIGQLARLCRGVGIPRALRSAVARDLDDHVAHRHEETGADHALL